MLHNKKKMIFAIAMILGGCGTEAGNPKQPSPDPPLMLADLSAATDVLASQVDDVISSLSEGMSSSSTEFSLLGSLTINRDCKEDNGQAVVKRTASGENSWQVKRQTKQLTYTASGSDETTIVWKKDGSVIHCNAARTAPRILGADIDGLGMQVDFVRSKQSTWSFPSTGEIARSNKITTTGSRSITWSGKSVADDGNPTINKSIANKVSRTIAARKKSGAVVDLLSSIETVQDKNLVVTVKRDKSTAAWLSHTIQSGSVLSTQDDRTKIEMSYDQVKFTRNGGCTPESGSISGKIFADQESDPRVTFTVTFSEDHGTVVFGTGEQFDFSQDRCELED